MIPPSGKYRVKHKSIVVLKNGVMVETLEIVKGKFKGKKMYVKRKVL